MLDALTALYLAVVAVLSAHGVHRAVHVVLWARTRGRPPVAPPLAGDLPRVTVQLPVYDERDVVGRLVDAAAALDWPADRLQIQLLDDSTDDTARRAAPALARARARGIAVEVRRRDRRTGFKAGALDAALAGATGELIAIFDADFVPDPDFLRRTVPHFADPAVGMVQARWEHLNADASLLCAAQAVLLDGHFRVEQVARNRSGAWFNFNGTAGVWRRRAIDGAGGWQHDTLTEDLDLSYRAQLAGWRFVFLDDVAVPAELPDHLGAFRAQQRRWAKGSLETARKLVPRLVRAAVPLRVRGEAVAHLLANLAWPLVVLLSLLLPAVVVVRGTAASGVAAVDLAAFLFSVGASAAFYAAASPGRLRHLPAVLALGVGMALNQSGAVIEALAGRRSPFVRTPKNGGSAGSYRPPASGLPVELAFAALQLGALAVAVGRGAWGSVPFLVLFAAGYGWVGVEALRGLRPALAPRPDAEPAPGK